MAFYVKQGAPGGKELLAKYNRKQLRNFKLNQSPSVTLSLPSIVPGVVINGRTVQYTKKTYNDVINIIKKEGEFSSFTWRITSLDKLKEATRWGIVKTQSVTSQVIAALGQYRSIVFERIKAGLISNRYILKDKLLSHYQDRFEALREMESLVNCNNPEKECAVVFEEYCKTLGKLKAELDVFFDNDNTYFAEVDHDGIRHIKAEIDVDIKQAKQFLNDVKNKPLSHATGVNSILTFVKTQMIRNLRQFQNHNQNITYGYSQKFPFAATRGDLNSCIEDAEKNHRRLCGLAT